VRFQIVDGADFRVAEQFTDPTTGALETTGTKVLRILRIVWGGTYQAYDTSLGAGSHFNNSVTDANSKITMTHTTCGGLSQGIWESAAIDYTSFVAGDDYIFQFENNDDTVFQSYEVKYKGAAMWANVEQVDGDASAAVRLALSAAQMIPGTVASSPAPTDSTFFASDITEATPDHFRGRLVLWTTGALAGQTTTVKSYALQSGTGRFDVITMTEIPSASDTFLLV